MEEKDSHFIQSLALALAAFALLFFFLGKAILFVGPAAGKVAPIEVQFGSSGGGEAGSGSHAAARAPGGPPKQARAAVPAPIPTKAAVKAAPAVRPVQPAPAVTPTAAPPPPPQETPSPAVESSNGTGSARGSGQQETEGTGTSGGGSGTAGVGSGGTGGTGGSGAGTTDAGGPAEVSPVATIADIDPVPIREITAAYPSSAKRLGQEGLVKIQADIDRSGAVVDSKVTRSSGFASLDNAALDAVKSTRFLPALKNGRAVEASIIIPVRFRLKN